MPDGKTPITNFNPNEFKVVDNSKKTVTDFNPNEFKIVGQASPKLREGDTNIVVPKYTTPKDLEIDSTLNFIQENSLRNMRDDEKDILKNMMKNPLTSKEELSDAIVTLQGKKAKQIDNSWTTPDYYMKRDEKSGNYKPVALEQGEKIPVGYHAASIWGTKLSAKNDNAWQDIGKSLVNGVVALGGGVVDVAQSGHELVTGDQSETLRSGKNTIEGLKFEKDADLDRPVYNMEGITKWADLLDKDRFDFGPQALWGTFNSTVESFTEFGLGSLTGATWIKGAKALKYGYKGVDIALDLGKAGKLGAIFTGSFFTNIGDARDAAEEAGLQGRDKGAVSLGFATVKSVVDAAFGLEGKIMSNAFKSGEREVLKNVIKKAETDAVTGLLTKNGFKQVMKDFTTEYSVLAKAGLKGKQVVKDMIEEGSNEVATDFAQKAGEQLWDKLTPDERGQFGTDALSAQSFGQYANSFFNGAISGGMMSIPSQVLKNNHDKQSVNAYERVKEGAEAVNALRTDLNNALDKGEITPSEHEQANFKIDAYSKYNEETKDVNLKPDEEKKAFELSFQIQGLKTEIPTNENEISKLDPIPRGIVEGKQSQYKKLQKELTEIIERGQVKGEPVVAKKTEEAIVKEKEKEATENIEETNSKLNQKKVEKTEPKTVVKKEKSTYVPIHSTLDKRNYEDVSADEFNEDKFPTRTRHRMARKYIYNQPNNKVDAKMTAQPYIYDGKLQYTYKGTMPDGKELKFSSSMMRPEGFRGRMMTERLKGNAEGLPIIFKSVDLGNVPEGYKSPEGYNSKKKAIMIYQKSDGKFLGWAKETHKGKTQDADGNELYNDAEKDLMAHLETIDEKPTSEQEMESARLPIKPTEPTTSTPIESIQESETDATSQSNKELEELDLNKEEELKFARKPELKLNFITKRDVLNKEIKTTAIERESGNEMEIDAKVSKVQSQIKKKLKVLELLNNCIHG